ncbi:MAG: hypothetical protein CMM84_20440 [Rhodothermaceae bacterium]|nr:hypothetical protein [Rhodothermaceae bacterium]MBC12658.1 hypothetical protein [Rhodothermaceae bacterium]
MTLSPAHAQWFSRLFEARTRSWAYLLATVGKGVGLTLIVAPFLILFSAPLLPAALSSPVQFEPTVWVGFLLAVASSLGQSAVDRRFWRRLGVPPADLGEGIGPVTLIPYALARRALHRRTVTDIRHSTHSAQGWIATALWLYADVSLVLSVAAVVAGMITGRLTVG